MRPALWLAVPVGLASVAVLVTCRTATEVTIVLSTDVDCIAAGTDAGSGVTVETALYGGDGSGTFASVSSADTTACDPVPDPVTNLHRIGSIVLVPSGSKDGSFGIEAIASLNGVDKDRCKAYFDEGAPDPGNTLKTSCIKETRDLSFIAHDDSRTLEIVLPDQCLGVICKPGTTCALDGNCVPEPSCSSSGDCAPAVDDGGAVDAGPSDAGASDAGTSDAGGDAALPDGSSPVWSHTYPHSTGLGQFADSIVVDYRTGAILFAGSYTGGLALIDAASPAIVPAGFAASADQSGTTQWVSLVQSPASEIASLLNVGPVVGGPPPDAGQCFVALVGPDASLPTATRFGSTTDCTLGGLGGEGDAGMRAAGVTSSVVFPGGLNTVGAFEATLTPSAQFTAGGGFDSPRFVSATFARFAENGDRDAGVGYEAAVVIVPPGTLYVTINDPASGTTLFQSLTSTTGVAPPFQPLSAAVAVDPNGTVAVACLYTGNPPAGINTPGTLSGKTAVFVATFQNLAGLQVITSTGAIVGDTTVSPDALAIAFPFDVYVAGAGIWSATTPSNTGFYVLHVDPSDAGSPTVRDYSSSAVINHLGLAAIPPYIILAGGYTGGNNGPLRFDDGVDYATTDPSDIFLAKITAP